MVRKLVASADALLVERGEELLARAVPQRRHGPQEVTQRGAALRHADVLVALRAASHGAGANILQALHRAPGWEVLHLRQGVQDVGDRLQVHVFFRDVREAPGDGFQGLVPGVFLEYVKRPEQIRDFGDDVRLTLPAPRALEQVDEIPARVEPHGREPPRAVAQPLRRERLELTNG